MRETCFFLEQDNEIIKQKPVVASAETRTDHPSLHREDIYDPFSGVTISIWSAHVSPVVVPLGLWVGPVRARVGKT
jgi:hypothetical protein